MSIEKQIKIVENNINKIFSVCKAIGILFTKYVASSNFKNPNFCWIKHKPTPMVVPKISPMPII
jgi:hypothetical protein